MRILAIIKPSIAAGMSASGRMMNGALPPSSIEQLTTWSAASRSSARPTAVEPVKESLRTRGSCNISRTMTGFSVDVTTLTTPGGTPASVTSSAT